jgi:hypothetical protein
MPSEFVNPLCLVSIMTQNINRKFELIENFGVNNLKTKEM